MIDLSYTIVSYRSQIQEKASNVKLTSSLLAEIQLKFNEWLKMERCCESRRRGALHLLGDGQKAAIDDTFTYASACLAQIAARALAGIGKIS